MWHFCHLRTYLAIFATYKRIWHFLPLTSVSDIFCHFNYEHICHARQREEAKAMAANYSLTLVLSMLFISIGLSIAVLDRYLPGSADDISRDELIERYFHLEFQHSEILLFLIMSHGIVLSLRQLKRILAHRALTRRLR